MHGLEARARMAVPRNCGQGAKTGWGGWAWYEHRLEARGTVQTPRTGGGANRGQAFRRPLNGAVVRKIAPYIAGSQGKSGKIFGGKGGRISNDDGRMTREECRTADGGWRIANIECRISNNE